MCVRSIYLSTGSWRQLVFGINDLFPSPSGALPQNHAVTCRHCEAPHSPAPCPFRVGLGRVWLRGLAKKEVG